MTPEEILKLPYRPCVGVMLMNDDGHVFVGQRIDRDQSAWQMPQGGVDKAEDRVNARAIDRVGFPGDNLAFTSLQHFACLGDEIRQQIV
ncbi:MAG: NUDIX domain-containing protein, partial [Pseudomonadota bacterium]